MKDIMPTETSARKNTTEDHQIVWGLSLRLLSLREVPCASVDCLNGKLATVGDFEKILPGEITHAATRTPADTEWVIPFPEVEQAIQFASRHLIAVLGVEVFRVLETGLGVENYSGYEFDPEGDWTAFVTRNNEAALRFIAENVHGTGYGYILTTSSLGESETFTQPTQI
jgi:hypothetical protein